MSLIVTGPGLFDVPEQIYHADTALAPELGRSLSVSGAKTLLRSPAQFAYQREHGTPNRDAFDLGSAAHTYVLGNGASIARVEATDWRTKEARLAKEEARAAGLIPLLAADDDKAQRMADAVLSHTVARRLFTEGIAEQSFYWIDEQTNVTLRGRADWLRANAVIDLKSAVDASVHGFTSAAAKFGYAQQQRWYQDGIEAVTGERLPFVFVVVEKEPPHLVGIYDIDTEWEALADAQNRRAIDLYAHCEATGDWPGLHPDTVTLSAPRWLTYQESA